MLVTCLSLLYSLATCHLSLVTVLQMPEQKSTPERKSDDGEVVYRRISPGVEMTEVTSEKRDKRAKSLGAAPLAPTLKIIIVGFALLLALVALLGFLSVRKADEVGTKILDDERRYAAIRDFTLDLRNASTVLDYEARARGRRLGA